MPTSVPSRPKPDAAGDGERAVFASWAVIFSTAGAARRATRGAVPPEDLLAFWWVRAMVKCEARRWESRIKREGEGREMMGKMEG